MRRVLWLAVLSLLVASPAEAGFTVPLFGEAAYGYTTGCTSTGTGLGGRTVPRCLDDASGTFILRYSTRVLTGAAVFTLDQAEFINVTGGGATSSFSLKARCIALVEGYDTDVALPWTSAAEATISKTINGDTDCDSPGETCRTDTPSGSTAIYNPAGGGGNCASTTCNNYNLICRFQYDGSVANTVDDFDITSVQLTVGP